MEQVEYLPAETQVFY